VYKFAGFYRPNALSVTLLAVSATYGSLHPQLTKVLQMQRTMLHTTNVKYRT